LLDWHRNDPPDDFEMNRNNIIYEWQHNRNPFIDQPELIEYIWGNQVGGTWLSMDEYKELNLSVYPNPTNGRIFIKGLKNEAKATVYSVDGRVLFTETLNKSFLDLNLSSGMYLLQITSDNKTTVKKILIN